MVTYLYWAIVLGLIIAVLVLVGGKMDEKNSSDQRSCNPGYRFRRLLFSFSTDFR